MLTLSPQLEEAIRLLAESRKELFDLLGDDHVDLPASTVPSGETPIARAQRLLAESRRELEDLLADDLSPDDDDD